MTLAPSTRRAFSIWEVLLIVVAIAILAAIAVPSCGHGYTRAAVSRAQADMRSTANALVSYYVDNNGYPLAMAPAWDRRHVGNSLIHPPVRLARVAGAPEEFGPLADKVPLNASARRLAAERVTFAHPGTRWDKPGGFATLTTPIAYLGAYFRDPFSPAKSLGYSYLPDGPGFVLASFPPSELSDHGGEPNAEQTKLSPLAQALRAQFAERATTPFDGRAVAASKAWLRVGAGPDGRALTYDPTNGTRSRGSVYRTSD